MSGTQLDEKIVVDFIAIFLNICRIELLFWNDNSKPYLISKTHVIHCDLLNDFYYTFSFSFGKFWLASLPLSVNQL